MMDHALKIQEDNSAFMMSMLGIIVSANTPEMVKKYAFFLSILRFYTKSGIIFSSLFRLENVVRTLLE